FSKIGNGDSFGITVEYIELAPDCKGTMEALATLRDVHSTFLFTFSDIIYGMNDLSSIWNAHISYKGIATLHIQASLKESGNAGVVVLDGNTVKRFIQKPGSATNPLLHFTGIVVAEPEFLKCTGSSMEDNVFPRLAENGALKGYIGPQPVYHFHTTKELKKIEKLLAKFGQ
ncbi:MAG: sugar phosphate nucleotidyltransferase, partial [archaeon]